MANNQYVNKIVYYGETLIDLTSDTVVPSVLLSGYTAHAADGSVITGSYVPTTQGIVVTEETDTHGGIIKHIVAIDLSEDTVTAGTLLSGYTAHDRFGNSVTGNLVPTGVDTSNDTVTVNTLLAGYTAHDSTGAQITGQYVAPDLSQDTVAAGSMLYGATAHDASGTAITGTIPSVVGGTPVATKGTVSNHSVTVTPSVTNVTGYITGGTLTGTAVTVSASELVSGSQTISSNQTVDVTNLAEVVVAVPSGSPNLQSKTATPTESEQTITADTGYDGLDTVTVEAISSTYVGSGIDRRDSTDLTKSGATISVPAGYYASNASKSVTTATQATPSVSVDTTTGLITATSTQSAGYVSAGTKTGTEQLSTQAGATISPTESEQTAVAAGKYTLGAVKVGAISSTYVGSGIDQRDSTDLTTSGATVSVPAGYYAEAASKSVASGSVPDPTISISSGGLITATTTPTAGYVTATASTNTQQMTTQAAKTVSPTESEQTAVASGVYTTGIVKVGAISSTYVGSGITQRSSTDLSASGATVTVPAGYYAEQATKSVSTMTLPTSASVSATSGYTSKATISRSTSDQYINIPTGYNSAGAYYKVSAVANGSVTAPSSISGTSASVSTGTNTLTLTKTVSVTPNVTAAGYISSGTAGNSSVSLTASVTTLGATTYNTSSSNQTIASGTYLTGTQTIRAVTTSGISAANIKSGVTVNVGDSADADRIVGVTGTFTSSSTVSSGQTAAAAGQILSGYSAWVNGSEVQGSLVIQHYYTGTGTPSSSLGVNGDIYLKTS
jgi:hypothetical protein